MSPFRLACPVMIGAAFCFGPDAYSASADPRPAGITHFEVATGLAVDEPTAVTGSAKPGGPGPATLRFNAFGNRFELEVRPNYRLVAPLLARGQLAYDDVRVFTATLPSVPGSWGRFTLRGEQVTGVLWDGTTMYLVDTAANLQSLLPSPVPAGSIVVFSSTCFHRSGANSTDKLRRAYALQYSPEPVLEPDGSLKGLAVPFLEGGRRVR